MNGAPGGQAARRSFLSGLVPLIATALVLAAEALRA